MVSILHFADATRRCKQGFGRNTAAIDTGAAHIGSFNDGGLETLANGLDGRPVAADTPAPIITKS
jgi:hypothetical protein